MRRAGGKLIRACSASYIHLSVAEDPRLLTDRSELLSSRTFPLELPNSGLTVWANIKDLALEELEVGRQSRLQAEFYARQEERKADLERIYYAMVDLQPSDYAKSSMPSLHQFKNFPIMAPFFLEDEHFVWDDAVNQALAMPDINSEIEHHRLRAKVRLACDMATALRTAGSAVPAVTRAKIRAQNARHWHLDSPPERRISHGELDATVAPAAMRFPCVHRFAAVQLWWATSRLVWQEDYKEDKEPPDQLYIRDRKSVV